VAYLGEKRNAYRDLVGEPEGNVSLGGAQHRYVYNIKIDLIERLGGHGLD